MRYLPAQVKEALGISEETFRHWRSALPPLKGKRGYGPCFTPGELLALKVVAQFHGFGIPVRQLKPNAEALFDACAQGAWFSLADKAVVFDGNSMEMMNSSQEARMSRRARVLIPLAPLIDELRSSLSEEMRPAQPEIVFPPLEVVRSRG